MKKCPICERTRRKFPGLIAIILSILLLGMLVLNLQSVSYSASVQNIKITDFQIIEWHWNINRLIGGIDIIGEIKNNGNIAIGVELQAIARNNKGNIIDSAEFWPASVKNIPAGGTWPIRYSICDEESDDDVSAVELRVIDVKIW